MAEEEEGEEGARRRRRDAEEVCPSILGLQSSEGKSKRVLGRYRDGWKDHRDFLEVDWGEKGRGVERRNVELCSKGGHAV